MRSNPEYHLYRQIAYYLRVQYPKILYHYDPTGLNLSKAQSGMLKGIQHSKGYPDLFIAEPRADFHGLYVELKPEGTKIYKRDLLTPATDHIAEQIECIKKLNDRGYAAAFGVGFESTKKLIDQYLKLKT